METAPIPSHLRTVQRDEQNSESLKEVIVDEKVERNIFGSHFLPSIHCSMAQNHTWLIFQFRDSITVAMPGKNSPTHIASSQSFSDDDHEQRIEESPSNN